jgi:formylglycine-generating enzyme required for sulfatase activity
MSHPPLHKPVTARLIPTLLNVSLAALAITFWACQKSDNETFVLPSNQIILDARDSTRVLVPAGYAVLGNLPQGWGNYTLPSGQDTAWVDSFYIDRYEVSNQKYADYLNLALIDGLIDTVAGNVYDLSAHLLIKTSSPDCRIHFVDSLAAFVPVQGSSLTPAALVSWYGAGSFAAYFDLRLPSDAEWEKAARGIADVFGTRFGIGYGYPYPWGDTEPSPALANFGKPPNTGAPQPVNSYPQGMSWYGALNMAGNVMEWTASSIGSTRILRGGSYSSTAADLHTGNRFYYDPNATFASFGFRCVADP